MRNIYFNFFGVLFIVVFIITTSIYSQIMPMKNGFYVGYQGLYYNHINWNFYFQDLKALNTNFLQNYGHHAEYNDSLDGGFRDSLAVYKTNVSNFLSLWGSNFGNNALFMEREKVLRAAYGQMSDYEAEFIPLTTHPQYGYANRKGAEYDTLLNGETIRGLYAGPPDDTGYWLISGLIENQEQISRPDTFGPRQNWPINYYYSDVKTPGYRLFIMPRMRIRTEDAFGTEKPVCRISIVPYDGINIVNLELTTKDFRLSDTSYDGRYIDIYYNSTHLRDFSILASVLNNGNTAGTDGKSMHPENSQVDYRIYWYGKVNLWLDRVRVADEWAFYLFHPELEANPKYYDFVNKIHDECTSSSIGSHPNFGYFYIDEYMYNSLPCIAEVNRLIKQYKPNSGLIAESNISLIGKYSGLVDTVSADSVYARLASSKAVTDILFMYQYPFTYKRTESGDTTLFPLPSNITLPDPSPSAYPEQLVIINL